MQGDSMVTICNGALLPLGIKPILNPAETNERVRTCNILYDQCRKEVLSQATWSFATGRATLTELSEKPPSEFAAYFELPGDYLKIDAAYAGTEDKPYTWRMEADSSGRPVLAVSAPTGTPVTCRYTRDVKNAVAFSSGFVGALKALLQANFALKFKGSEKLRQEALSLYSGLLQAAEGSNTWDGDPTAYSEQPRFWADDNVLYLARWA